MNPGSCSPAPGAASLCHQMALLPFRNPGCSPGSVMGLKSNTEELWRRGRLGKQNRSYTGPLELFSPESLLHNACSLLTPANTHTHTATQLLVHPVYHSEKCKGQHPGFQAPFTFQACALTHSTGQEHVPDTETCTPMHWHQSSQTTLSHLSTYKHKPTHLTRSDTSLLNHWKEIPWPLWDISGLSPPALPVSSPSLWCASESSSHHPEGH